MKKNKEIRGRVFYDAECGLCERWVRLLGGPFRRAGFVFEPMQSAIASGAYSISADEFLKEMKLRRPDGTCFGGVDAWIEMFQAVSWLRPLARALQFPVFYPMATRLYRWFAAHRRCFGGTCPTRRRVFLEDP